MARARDVIDVDRLSQQPELSDVMEAMTRGVGTDQLLGGWAFDVQLQHMLPGPISGTAW